MDRRGVISSLGVWLGASTLVGRAGSAWAQTPAGSGNRIVLGQSAPFSGPFEQLAVQYHLGAKLFFDDLNAKGGVNGRTVELRRLDDGYAPERCVANTKQLMADGVFALFGYVGTPTSQAALPLATEAKLPFFAPLSGAQSLREPFNRFVFHVRASVMDETAAIIRQTQAVGIRKFAVFHQNDPDGLAGLAGVTHALKALNLAPLAIGSVDSNSAEVGKAVADIVAARPEAIVQVGTYRSCASFVRQARQKGFTGGFYDVSIVGTQALMDELGTEAKGVSVSQVVPFPYAAATQISRDYIALHKDLHGISPNYAGMEGFIAAKVFTEGLRRAGRNPTREAFVAALETMKGFDLGGYPVDFGPDRHTGSRFVELTLLTGDGRVRR
ncbi:MAG: ABC transporter substrate-binding protein [Hydrogenophaga sp.]|nr:ABC transporter substrate-binding protein [Hydrogenophaga sp.]